MKPFVWFMVAYLFARLILDVRALHYAWMPAEQRAASIILVMRAMALAWGLFTLTGAA